MQLQSCNIIAAEIQDDFDVGVISIPPVAYERKHNEVKRVVQDYRRAMKDGNWQGLYPHGGDLKIPNWDMTDEGELLTGFDQ